ncbi:hypothetical protein EON62_02310 [archaeon]|nr:MAG: hypothetical protein EON62_02310 [archaeon]
MGTPTRTTPSRKPSSGTPGSGSSRRSVKQSVASPPRPLPELPTDARGGILLQPNEGGVTSEEGTTGLSTHMPPRPRRAVGAYQSLLIRADSAGSMSGAPGPASLTPTATNEGGYTPSASAATSMVGKPPLARVPSRPRRGTSHSLSSLDASDTESELASLPSAHAPSHTLSTSSTSQRVAATLGAGAVQQEELYARVSTPTDQLIVAASSAPGGTGGRGGGSVGGRTPATPGTPVRPPSGRRASKTVTPSGSATAALQELMTGDAGEVLAEYTDAGVIKSHSALSGASPARRTALPLPRAAALFRDLPGGTDDVELGTGGDVSTVAPVRSLASVAAIGASPARSAVLLAPSTGSSAVARRSRATSRGRINSVSSDADSDGTVEAIPPTRISAGRSPKHPGLLSASRGGSASEDEEGGMLLPRTAPSTQPLGASPAAPPAAEKRPTRRVGPARMVAPPAL